MRTARRNRIAVDSEQDRAPAVPPGSRQGEVASLTSGSTKDMAEEEKTKEEPKQDSGKPIKNGGYTSPVQMY